MSIYNVTKDTPIDFLDRPLLPMGSSLDIKYDKLEVKATGEAVTLVNDIIKTLLLASEVQSQFFETKTSNEDSLRKVYGFTLKDEFKGRAAESKEGREKPLDINIDLLKNKVRLPRMAEGFRCPSCGQGFIVKAVSSNKTQQMFIFRNANANIGDQKATLRKVNIKGLNVEDRENKEELITIYKGLSELSFEPVNLLYQEGTDCHCPICNEEHTLMDWIDAFTSPLNYFDREMICDICGDDAKLVMTGTTEYVECNDNCLSKTIDKEKHTNEDCLNDKNCEDACCDSCVDDGCCGNEG